MTGAVLALGANLDDARGALRTAVAAMSVEPGLAVTDVSGLWRTAPVGGPDQPDYLNAVVLVEVADSDVTLAARGLLAMAGRLERAAGRVRGVRWGPRTLDVDLIEVGSIRLADPILTLPHPRAHQRAFVLAPWLAVRPDAVLTDPAGTARPIRAWLADAADQGVEPVDDPGWWR